MLTMARLQQWLDAYVEAWRLNQPEAIGRLFSDDAVYAFDPFDEGPVRGRDAIVSAWLEKPDDPDSWECRYTALAVMGDLGIGRGWTRYRGSGEQPEREYRNLFVMRFDDQDRCREFTEWYLQRKRSSASTTAN